VSDIPDPSAASGYRGIFRNTRLLLLMGLSAIGRLGIGMVPLAVILTVADATRSFGTAGTCAGAFALTAATLAPLRARIADRYGQALGLAGLCGLFTVVILAIPVALHRGSAVLVVLSLLAGALVPPIGAATKAQLSAVLRPSALQAGYSLDTVLDVAVLTAAPAVAGLLVTASPRLATTMSACFVVAGVAGVVICRHGGTQSAATSPGESRSASLLRRPVFRWMLISSLNVGTALGVLEVVVPVVASQERRPGHAGYVLAVLFGASAIAGMFYGHRTWAQPLSSRFRMLNVGMVISLIPIIFTRDLIVLAAMIVLPGVAFGPLLISAYLLADRSSEQARKAEAMAWVTTSITAGAAVGLALGGLIADAEGHSVAVMVAVLPALAAAAASMKIRERNQAAFSRPAVGQGAGQQAR